MAFYPVVVGVQDQSGDRVDPTRPDGSRSPIILRAGQNVDVTGALDGQNAIVTIDVPLDTLQTVFVNVRNETGAPLTKGTLVSVVGYSAGEDRVLVEAADKDDAAKRPALGMLPANIADSTNGTAVAAGIVADLDTSGYALTDQLVLNSGGTYSKPPPDTSPFTGEIQNIGQVVRVHATLGQILVAIDGLNVVTGAQVFALAGTNGTPGPANKYVTDSDPRNTDARAPTAHAASHLPGGSDALTTAVPVSVGTANAEGSSPNFSRGDHQHKASLLQTTFQEVTVDTTTTSTTFVDLLTQSITTQAGTALLIHASTSASNTGVNQSVRFRVTIDGTAVRGWENVKTGAGQTAGGGFVYRKTGLSAAAHTIKVQWLVGGSTGQVRPNTAAIDTEHASLMCQEVLF